MSIAPAAAGFGVILEAEVVVHAGDLRVPIADIDASGEERVIADRAVNDVVVELEQDRITREERVAVYLGDRLPGGIRR